MSKRGCDTLCNVLLEEGGLGGLGVAPVAHLVEELVRDHKVVAE